MKIDIISETDYLQIIKNNEHHLQALENIIKGTGEILEGNSFYEHRTLNRHPDLIPKQRNIFSLAKGRKNILEIGFNAGHSCLLMLLASEDSKIVLVDICWHAYTMQCFAYLDEQFPGRLEMNCGDSTKVMQDWSGGPYDLYHIDGGHTEDIMNKDYQNCFDNSREDSIIIFDDSYMPFIRDLWEKCLVQEKIIPIKLLYTPMYSHEAGYIRKRPKYEYNIAVCSMALGDKYKKIVASGTLSRQLYCRKHGYDFYEDDDDEVHDKTRQPAWSKVNIIQRYLNHPANYDYVVWIDADTFIMNPNITLEQRIKELCLGHDITFARDFKLPNTGVMFIKNTQWSKDFFTRVYDHTDFLEHPNWEQGAIIDLHEKNVMSSQSHIKILHVNQQNLINSYWYNYIPGDFILHFPGCFRHNQNFRLDNAMDRFCPLKLSTMTNDAYEIQQKWLKTGVGILQQQMTGRQ